MDGENNEKPYEQMDDLGGKPTIFGNTHLGNECVVLKVVGPTRGWPPDSHENISIRGCVMDLDRFFSCKLECPVGREVRIPMVVFPGSLTVCP